MEVNKSENELVLSNNIIDGLKNLGTKLNIELSKKLLSNAVKLALCADARVPFNPEIYAVKPDCAKQSEYAVVSLLFLIMRQGYDKNKLKTLLQSHGIHNTVIEDIIKVCETNQDKLIAKNIKTGATLMHYSGDAEWRLSCDVKQSAVDNSSGEFLINLNNTNEQTGDRESIAQFACNTEELQALVNKLKKIENHCNRVYKSNIGDGDSFLENK